MSRAGRPELLLSLAALALPAMLAAPRVEQLSEASLAVHHALHWALTVDGAALGLLWSPRLRPFRRLAVPALVVGGGVQVALHIPPVWLWAVVQPLTHAALHGTFLVSGLLIGAGLGLVGSIGRSWFVIVAGGLMAPITLGMLAGAVSYPPYPVSESESAGVVMLVAMQFLWLLALPGSRLLRAARAHAGALLLLGASLAAASWLP